MKTYNRILATLIMSASLCSMALAAPETISKDQVITIQSVSLKQAQVMAQAAEQRAKEIGVPMIIAVVDASGNMVLHERMEDALLVSIDVSLKKAYSAVALKMPTDKLATVTQPKTELYGIQHSDDKLITFGGGFPIVVNGKIVGAIGVSGGSVAQDMDVATAGLKALK
ncbi:GlcG/HbpS family heme-binding protein [Neisseria sp. Ec49-e6-T10]|uniref:GlcG/HbpS family heme-binding protein n=1 Tax=Neisseria sp. Ec49-e6-T10 TaxID=3140744 RepID=UPI003EBF8F9D